MAQVPGGERSGSGERFGRHLICQPLTGRWGGKVKGAAPRSDPQPHWGERNASPGVCHRPWEGQQAAPCTLFRLPGSPTRKPPEVTATPPKPQPGAGTEALCTRWNLASRSDRLSSFP